jgi:hypothetical protein
MEGISPRQGGHQVAQKFRNTTFPFSELNETFFPLRSASVKSMDEDNRVPSGSLHRAGLFFQ